MNESDPITGGCLCGEVQFEVSGQLRQISYCHCIQCRKTSGHFVAATATDSDNLSLMNSSGLSWYRSSKEAERGFCRSCGSSLFWRRIDGSGVSIMAGSIDGETGVKPIGHIFTEFAGDYYSIDDELPCYDGYR